MNRYPKIIIALLVVAVLTLMCILLYITMVNIGAVQAATSAMF